MKIRLLVLAGALFVAGGTSRADIAIVVFCAPGLDASGKVVTKCTPAPGGDGQDPGTGGWQQPDPGWLGYDGMGVTGATYGGNCGAHLGNAGYDLEVACDGAMTCSYTIDYRVLGDPAPGCAKDFSAVYLCPGSTVRHHVYVAPEAGFGKVLTMSCE